MQSSKKLIERLTQLAFCEMNAPYQGQTEYHWLTPSPSQDLRSFIGETGPGLVRELGNHSVSQMTCSRSIKILEPWAEPSQHRQTEICQTSQHGVDRNQRILIGPCSSPPGVSEADNSLTFGGIPVLPVGRREQCKRLLARNIAEFIPCCELEQPWKSDLQLAGLSSHHDCIGIEEWHQRVSISEDSPDFVDDLGNGTTAGSGGLAHSARPTTTAA